MPQQEITVVGFLDCSNIQAAWCIVGVFAFILGYSYFVAYLTEQSIAHGGGAWPFFLIFAQGLLAKESGGTMDIALVAVCSFWLWLLPT